MNQTGNGTSDNKIEANRRNALRSTGPKTTEGKRRASRNALKHALLAKELLIDGGDGQENAAELVDLFNRIWEDRQPVGALEEMLVEAIAVSYWRKRRAVRCEAG
jgi:hypothetical protein